MTYYLVWQSVRDTPARARALAILSDMMTSR